jgi:hypothetical protein
LHSVTYDLQNVHRYLIFFCQDQQITAVIVNRKENLLKKGGGYHLDLLIVAVGVVINSIFGIPW